MIERFRNIRNTDIEMPKIPSSPSRRRFLRLLAATGATVIFPGIPAAVDIGSGAITDVTSPNANKIDDGARLLTDQAVDKVLQEYTEKEIPPKIDEDDPNKLSLDLENDGQLLLKFTGQKDPTISMRLFKVKFEDRIILVPLVQGKNFNSIGIHLGWHTKGTYDCHVEEVMPDGSFQGILAAQPQEKAQITGYSIYGHNLIENTLPPLIRIREDNIEHGFVARVLNDVPLFERMFLKSKTIKSANGKEDIPLLEEQFDLVSSSEDLDVSGILDGRPYDYETVDKELFYPDGTLYAFTFQGRNHAYQPYDGERLDKQPVFEIKTLDGTFDQVRKIDDSKKSQVYFSFAIDPRITPSEWVERLDAYKVIGKKELQREGSSHMGSVKDKVEKVIFKRFIQPFRH